MDLPPSIALGATAFVDHYLNAQLAGDWTAPLPAELGWVGWAGMKGSVGVTGKRKGGAGGGMGGVLSSCCCFCFR